MRISISHSSMPLKNHTAWEEIFSFAKHLRSLDKSFHVTIDPIDKLESTSFKSDILYLFCSGKIDDRAWTLIGSAARVIPVVQDFNWYTQLPRGIDEIITPLVDLNKRVSSNLDYDRHSMVWNTFMPFGLIGALDERRQEIMKSHIGTPIRGLDESLPSYVGSLKIDRVKQIFEHYERFNLIGNVSHDKMIDVFGRDLANRVNLIGWLPPEHTLRAYCQSSELIVVTDLMTEAGLDYNRPYDIASSGVKVSVIGDYAEKFVLDWSVDSDGHINHDKLIAEKMKEHYLCLKML